MKKAVTNTIATILLSTFVAHGQTGESNSSRTGLQQIDLKKPNDLQRSDELLRSQKKIPPVFLGEWHPDPRGRTWQQIFDQEGDQMKGVKIEAGHLSYYESGLSVNKVVVMEQGRAIRVGGRWSIEGTDGDYEELSFRISQDGKVLETADGTRYSKAAKEQIHQTLRARLHNKICSKSSKVYMGRYHRQRAIFSIQWMGDDTLRGSMFLYDEGRELSLYGTNYVQGQITCEVWETGKLLGKITLNKRMNKEAVSWVGWLEDGVGRLQLSFSRSANRGSSEGFVSYYVGRVGRSDIDVTLEWKKGATISGHYQSRATGRRYRLEGDNTVDGFLYLDEFTNENLSARVLLVKKPVRNGSIAWVGSMYNTDGRRKDMFFMKR